MRLVLTIVAVIAIAALAVAGFALALPTYNTPAQYRLALAGNKTNDCVVRVVGSATNEFLVAQNGEVTIDVPRLPRTCSWMWFGLTIRDGSPKRLKAIEILQDGRIIRQLSLRELERLPVDPTGVKQISLTR